MSIILNEKKYAEEILESREIGTKPSATLFLLGKYYRKVIGYDSKDTYVKLDEFMRNNYKNYNSVLWEDIIEDISKKSSKYDMREIDNVGITEKELETIATLKDITLEKLVFAMLCHAKLYNASSESNNNWVNTKLPEIFKSARVSVKFKNDKMLLINKLLNANLLKNVNDDGVITYYPLISISKKNTNKNIQLLFVDSISDPILYINDFRELGYEYLLYLGENYYRCDECGILFKQNKNSTYKYCIKHRGYQPKETKTIQCIDCGVNIKVDARNNTKTRCDECYEIYRKEKSREKALRYYHKNKTLPDDLNS